MSPKKLKKSSGNAIEPDCDEAKPVVANKNNESFATFEFDERLLKVRQFLYTYSYHIKQKILKD